jgi:flavin-dependent dehydrogenase
MPAPVILPQRTVPVAYEADIVVVGAGPGGFAAALQAARMGARVVVVERHNMPGGPTPRACRAPPAPVWAAFTPS